MPPVADRREAVELPPHVAQRSPVGAEETLGYVPAMPAMELGRLTRDLNPLAGHPLAEGAPG